MDPKVAALVRWSGFSFSLFDHGSRSPTNFSAEARMPGRVAASANARSAHWILPRPSHTIYSLPTPSFRSSSRIHQASPRATPPRCIPSSSFHVLQSSVLQNSRVAVPPHSRCQWMVLRSRHQFKDCGRDQLWGQRMV